MLLGLRGIAPSLRPPNVICSKDVRRTSGDSSLTDVDLLQPSVGPVEAWTNSDSACGHVGACLRAGKRPD